MILGVPAAHGLVVATVDQQPVLASVATEVGADEDEPTMEFLSMELDLELATCECITASGTAGSAVQRPQSQTMTSPAPYSARGMRPSNAKYSSGWSSTRTARRRTRGSSDGPRGTAHETSTPLISRRTS
jgi:hypothetical protein